MPAPTPDQVTARRRAWIEEAARDAPECLSPLGTRVLVDIIDDLRRQIDPWVTDWSSGGRAVAAEAAARVARAVSAMGDVPDGWVVTTASLAEQLEDAGVTVGDLRALTGGAEVGTPTTDADEAVPWNVAAAGRRVAAFLNAMPEHLIGDGLGIVRVPRGVREEAPLLPADLSTLTSYVGGRLGCGDVGTRGHTDADEAADRRPPTDPADVAAAREWATERLDRARRLRDDEVSQHLGNLVARLRELEDELETTRWVDEAEFLADAEQAEVRAMAMPPRPWRVQDTPELENHGCILAADGQVVHDHHNAPQIVAIVNAAPAAFVTAVDEAVARGQARS